MKRRDFIKASGLTGAALSAAPSLFAISENRISMKKGVTSPVCIATWNFPNASKMAGEMLYKGASALDAVEQGVRVEEANIKNTTVGKGGAPDRDGNVTLDASIMAPDGNCGSVAYLKQIAHPVSVARKVMEETPNVMLVGEGALQFALEQGFEKEDLSPKNRKRHGKNG